MDTEGEARGLAAHHNKPQSKPSWLRVRAAGGENYHQIRDLLSSLGLATVCQEARCPNIGECWRGGTATFMLMGEVCTRGCRFCAVKTGNPKKVLDVHEPSKVSEAIGKMGLSYVVLTSVDRDDLIDQGSGHFAETIRQIKADNPGLLIEVLTPDFKGDTDLVHKIVLAQPDVYAHNVETVERLTPKVRDRRAGYRQSLKVLEYVKTADPSRYTKTSLMLGLGERDEEIRQTLLDLRSMGCDVVTFGQYLQPTKRLLKVESFVHPNEFLRWKHEAEAMGFIYVASGPLVRSSYRAGEYFMAAMINESKGIKRRVNDLDKRADPNKSNDKPLDK